MSLPADDEQLLLLTPTGRDAALAADTLRVGGIAASICRDIPDFLRQMSEGAAGGILAEEAVTPQGLEQLAAALHEQPPWSDFPLVLLAAGMQSPMQSAARYRALQVLGNLTILERPFHRETLLIAAQSALRNRWRQYQARALLLERERAAEALAAHNENLEKEVANRIAEIDKKNEELYQARKLEAIGQLAGGIAHDFNNLMAGIMGMTEDLRDSFAPDDPRRQDAEEVLAASLRTTELTRQLLAFGRQQVISPGVIDLNAAVEETSKMLRRLIREDIQFSLQLGPPQTIRLDAGQLQQILMNLVVNARDAMPDGGRLTLATRAANACAVIEVSDTGIGMSPEVQARIFEPFFTTKARRGGTGLGLSTVFGIVKQNEGEIQVESRPGAGTTFRITFSVAEATASPSPKRSSLVASGQGETILVTEDEDIVRRVVAKRLRKEGYRVLEARNGSEAIAFARRETVDLILTDVVMPEISGPDVVKQVKQLRPQAAVLFVSGYPNEVIAHRGVLQPGINFLQKPVPPDLLSAKIREALDQARLTPSQSR